MDKVRLTFGLCIVALISILVAMGFALSSGDGALAGLCAIMAGAICIMMGGLVVRQQKQKPK